MNYLPGEFIDLYKYYEDDISVPFKVVAIKSNGFLVNVFKRWGYVSFDYMPWSYINKKSWEIVFPRIKGKIFFGKITSMETEPFTILINGRVQQFKKAELKENEVYNGIVVDKIKDKLVIDLGGSFEWKSGAILGCLHKSKCDSVFTIRSVNVGDDLAVCIDEDSTDGNVLLYGGVDYLDWETNTVDSLLNKTVVAKVVKTGKKNTLVVNGKYRGILSPKRGYYKSHGFQVKRAISLLKENDEIECIVTRIQSESKTLTLKWLISDEKGLGIPQTSPEHANSLENLLDSEILKKLKSLNKSDRD